MKEVPHIKPFHELEPTYLKKGLLLYEKDNLYLENF